MGSMQTTINRLESIVLRNGTNENN
jgi:hypothetical protein